MQAELASVVFSPTPHTSSMWPQPASQPVGVRPQPAASQPVGVRPQSAASQPVGVQPQPLGLQQHFTQHLRPQRFSEDQIPPGSGTNNLPNNLLTRILNSVEKLSERVEQISHQVRQNSIVLQNLYTQGATPAAVPDGLVLPLNSQEEVNRLEEGLTDKEFRVKVIHHLACIGGDSVSSLVRRILKRMLSAELALSYNFSGVKGKNSFHSLQMRGVLIAAVRRTFSSASEADIDAATRTWFSNARDRDGGRARRTSDGNRDN